MQNLTKASRELYRRQPDGCFESLTALCEHCRRQNETCVNRWVPPRSIQTNPADAGRLMLAAGNDGAFAETLPNGNKPLQLFTTDDLLGMVWEFAVDFEAPPK